MEYDRIAVPGRPVVGDEKTFTSSPDTATSLGEQDICKVIDTLSTVFPDSRRTKEGGKNAKNG